MLSSNGGAASGELPDPRRALGVIQQMRLALLCAEDAPCEDEVEALSSDQKVLRFCRYWHGHHSEHR